MNDHPEREQLSLAGWLAIVVLAALLAGAIWYAVRAWNALAGVGMSTFGWAMLALGAVVTIAFGGGLMALVFYSSRKNYDQ